MAHVEPAEGLVEEDDVGNAPDGLRGYDLAAIGVDHEQDALIAGAKS